MLELIWDNKKEMLEEINSEDFLKTDKYFEYNKEESKNFNTTENLYIEGDNLEALKLLQKDYNNKIKMIYIDPPYNTEKKFIYNDTFRNKRKKECRHSGWLNMMYPRLKLARDLLRDDGAIFISIDENEYDNLKKICDEIFYNYNYRNTLIVQRNSQNQTEYKRTLNRELEYILVYSKSEQFEYICTEVEFDEAQKKLVNKLENIDEINKTDIKNIKKAFNMISGDSEWKGFYTSKENRPTMQYPILGIVPYDKNNPIRRWMWGKDRTEIAVQNYNDFINEYGEFTFEALEEYISKTNKVDFVRRNKNTIQYYKRGKDKRVLGMNWTDVRTSEGSNEVFSIFPIKIFDNPKPIALISRIMDLVIEKDENCIVLDFFSGSATTAHAVMKLNAEDGGNRKFIMVQIPEECKNKNLGYDNICEIGKERIRRAGDKIVEENKNKEGIENLDIGFKVIKIK
ncbi:MAG: site-specific DNA-methyltransferase [Clostridium sp.]|nr:site-specific DNA-methyltransferase [Clostridium sp.]